MTDVAPPDRGAMPVVARPRAGLSNTAIAIGMAAAALLLFTALEARRTQRVSPAVRGRGAVPMVSEAPPPLYVPPPPVPVYSQPMLSEPAPAPVQAITPIREPATPRPQVSMPPTVVPQQFNRPVEPPGRERSAGGSALVIDNSLPRVQSDQGRNTMATADGASGNSNDSAARVRSGTIASRSSTVVQGTLIPAVLETALDSSRPGFARALVQRDVRGFDGTRVLIPRGSRLVGEYRSEVAPGQKRALVNWTRLIRPDGVTIAIGSPATDTVGTAGMKASVNTHLLERFSGAILQSVLDVGVTLAARSADSSLILLPGSINTGRSITPGQIPPTLKVKQGTSVSVFVARDLDFTGYDAP